MSKRKNISNKTRFEVFKRDNFTCQYCGKSAPEVVLNVDHIEPVSKGGSNDISNLITSCFECNNGKGNKKLSDKSELEKQHNELILLNERKKQLEQMMEWKKELINLDNHKVDMLTEYIEETLSTRITEVGKKKLKRWLIKYDFKDLVYATDKAFAAYEESDSNVVFDKIERIAYYEKHPVAEYIKKSSYIRGIFKNRNIFYRDFELKEIMRIWSENFDSFDIPIDVAKQTKTYKVFEEELLYQIDEVIRNGEA